MESPNDHRQYCKTSSGYHSYSEENTKKREQNLIISFRNERKWKTAILAHLILIKAWINTRWLNGLEKSYWHENQTQTSTAHKRKHEHQKEKLKILRTCEMEQTKKKRTHPLSKVWMGGRWIGNHDTKR